MNDIEKWLKNHITNMLENILTQPELKALARNKGIQVSGLDKDGLVNMVADAFISADHVLEMYKGLPP